MQGVRPCHFIDPSFCQSRHALKQSMWLLWLHSSYIYIYIHMKPAGVSHRLMQKEARGISEAKQARGKPELGFELSWSIRNPYRNSYGNHGNPYGNPYGWHDRQQHHPYGLPYDQYILHVWRSDHRFYGNSFGLRHKHFISKGVMASRFISIEWGALTPSWVS